MASCQKFKGAAYCFCSFRTLGEVLSAFESYRLGVVSTAVCLQKNIWRIIAPDSLAGGFARRNFIAQFSRC